MPSLMIQASRASSITIEHPLSPGQLRSAAREGPETLQQEQSTPGTVEKDVPGVLSLYSLQILMQFKEDLST